ncbi:Protein MALE DISCOVERER 2 [Linum perenne]
MMEKDPKFRCSVALLLTFFLYSHLILCSCSLDAEGLALLKFKARVVSDPFGALKDWKDGIVDHCSWFGVECSDGKVVSLVLRNNSFTGIIPEDIGELVKLEVLDLGFNNFSGSLPTNLGSNRSLTILLLDHNGVLSIFSPEIHQLMKLSEVQVDETELYDSAKDASCHKRCNEWWKYVETKDAAHRRLLQTLDDSLFNQPQVTLPPANRFFNPYELLPPLPSISIDPLLPPIVNRPVAPPPPAIEATDPIPQLPDANNQTSTSPNSTEPSFPAPTPTVPSSPNSTVESSHSKNHVIVPVAASVGGAACLLFAILGIYLCKTNKAAVKPWATGLSGQLQKALTTGVPKLKRSELEAACEDFSNVIGSSPLGMLYKGTLSSGVEIAVASVALSSKDWSRNLEVQFAKKIETLSKVNHKNFINLLGFCVEEEPFTRMLVFEYAPNGSLFEHLHIKESEHLSWAMRLRIMAGMAYCLEYMHQLNPPITHKNLNSSSVSLTEDYAAKLSDFSFSSNVMPSSQTEASETELSDMSSSSSMKSNVYSFGVLLFELMTGRVPYSVANGPLENWASDYLIGDQPLHQIVDPTLNSFEADKLTSIEHVIKYCVHPDMQQRPTMVELTSTIRQITGISPEAASPKLSPLWWAELEILSADGS